MVTGNQRLDQFGTFSIYQVLPEIIELWGLNVQTQVESKKLRATDREMTTPLLMLRCVQLGIHAEAFVPNGVICLMSAARYYELTNFLPDQ